MFARATLAALLAGSLALAGCGTTGSTPTAARAPFAPERQVAIGATAAVSLIANNSANARTVVGADTRVSAPSLRLVDSVDLSEEELANDAQAAGFSLFASDAHGFERAGTLRQLAQGFELVTSQGLFHPKTVTYALVASGTLAGQLAKHANKKVVIHGSTQADGRVLVASVRGALSLGFLTNWATKGRISGVIQNPAHRPIAGVKIEARSAEGFLFDTTSDDDGEFALRTLTPGAYNVTLTEAGFKPVTLAVTVQKRKATRLSGNVAVKPVGVPSAQPAASGTLPTR